VVAAARLPASPHHGVRLGQRRQVACRREGAAPAVLSRHHPSVQVAV
jgi:hypothetical protein